MKIVIFIIKRIVVSLCSLYTINILISKSGLCVPINMYSIISTCILGLPSILGIMIIKFIIM